MPAKSKMREIEDREGKPIRDLLRDLYLIHGKQTYVAKALGIDQSTLSLWLVKLDLQEKTILVPRKRQEYIIVEEQPRVAAADLPKISISVNRANTTS